MHYEWVELALDVSDEVLPAQTDRLVDAHSQLRLSPLAAVLAYAFPVQQIGPRFQPTEPGEAPTFLVVHRDHQHRVRFVSLNGMTYALLNTLESSPNLSLHDLAVQLRRLMQPGQNDRPSPRFAEQLATMVQQLADQQIILIR